MGWQGKVTKRAKLRPVAEALTRYFHRPIQVEELDVWCWRDNRIYHVWVRGYKLKVTRKTLEILEIKDAT